MKISDNALVQSRAVRDEGLSALPTQESQLKILQKVKQLYFSVWNGVGCMTSEAVEEFYESSKSTINKNLQRTHRSEFEADGVKTVTGEELRALKDIMSISGNAKHVTLLPLRAVLRMGFILRDSEIAKQVRDVALNIIEGVGQLLSREILEDLLDNNPPLQALVDQSDLKISVPLAPYWDAMKRGLKKSYPVGGIPGLSTKDIQNRIAALSTRIDIEGWEFHTQKELHNQTISNRTKYPDFSITLPVNVEGKQEKAIFMFLFDNLIIDYEYVEERAGRNYLKLAKNFPGIEHAFLFFVAPFGATPDAEIYLKQDWPAEKERGFVGVLTVKELSELLIKQARNCKKSNLVKGEIKRDFKELFDYGMAEPLLVMSGYTTPSF